MQCSHYCCLCNSGSSWGLKSCIALDALIKVMIIGSVCQNILEGAKISWWEPAILITGTTDMQWGFGHGENFHFSMISNRWKSLKTRLSARSELSCRWLNLHTCKDTWRLIFGGWSRHRCPNPPLHPPGITTNSLLGSPPSAVDTQPIHVGAAWSHVSSHLESSICGPCSLLALAPFGRLVFWQIVRLPLISWFRRGWRIFQGIWNWQRDSGGDLLIAKRKTQSIVVYSSTSRIREALKKCFF